jgi:hypothetical protein
MAERTNPNLGVAIPSAEYPGCLYRSYINNALVFKYLKAFEYDRKLDYDTWFFVHESISMAGMKVGTLPFCY